MWAGESARPGKDLHLDSANSTPLPQKAQAGGTFEPAYDSRHDGARLHSKQGKVREYKPATRSRFQTLDQIRTALEQRFQERFPAPSLSAFLRHLRKPGFGSFILEKRRRNVAGLGLWEYRLLPPKPKVQQSLLSGACS